MNAKITDITFWKATGIRCLRSFLTVILGAQTGGQLLTDIDWKGTLILAVSTTFWIFIACLIAGLPEVDANHNIYMDAEEPLDSFVSDGEKEATDGEK